MKKRSIIVVIALLVITLGLGFTWYYRDRNTSLSTTSNNQYRPAPNFELADADGKKYKLENFRGSVILLHFWASWCPPCIDEFPRWVKFGARFGGTSVKFIAVSLDQNWNDARKVLSRLKLPENVVSLLDVSGKVSEEYGTFQYPETYLLSPDLKVITKWVGSQPWDSPKLVDLLNKISAQANRPDAS